MVFKDIYKVFWPEAGRGESRVFLWALCKPVRLCGLGGDRGKKERGIEKGEGGREKGEGERERMTQRALSSRGQKDPSLLLLSSADGAVTRS